MWTATRPVKRAARGYGWDLMIEWTDYMATADLEHISEVTVSSLAAKATGITESYTAHGGKCADTPELTTEASMLSVAGISKVLRAPMKIAWINQTRIIRFFTLEEDDLLIRKYVETMVRRTFGTTNAMKLGKPLQEGSAEAFEMVIKDVNFLKGRGVVVDGFPQSGQISVNQTIFARGKGFPVRGIKTEKGMINKTDAGTRRVALLLGETESADHFKAGDMVTSVPR